MTIVSLLLFVVACISPYSPDNQGDNSLLVVDGSILKGVEKQVIRISKTSLISKPVFIPVENCEVIVMDSTGKEFVFNEESPGQYVAIIDESLLEYDMKYQLIFTTPSGDVYESDNQRLLKTAPVDSLYSIDEYQYSSGTNNESLRGMQFYTDLDAPENAPRYYRWVLEETWENHAQSEIWGEYDGLTIKPFYPRDSLYRCYETKNVNGLYSASTVHLSENRIKKIPLHFIASTSHKLEIKYCATIKQYALNTDAYEYWYLKEIELNESGGIHTSQPNQPKSNIINTNNPNEQVLGFFWASSCSMKRLFLNNPFHTFPPDEFCSKLVYYIESTNVNEILDNLNHALLEIAGVLPDPPVYITVERNTKYNFMLSPQCADCRAIGGDIQKPDFWE
jgi:hypothetical protein